MDEAFSAVVRVEKPFLGRKCQVSTQFEFRSTDETDIRLFSKSITNVRFEPN